MRSKMVAVVAFGAFVVLLSGSAVFAGEEEDEKLPPVPKEYADKHMPKGGWTDPAMLAAGKKIFEEKKKKIELGGKDEMVACADCHGKDGKPKKRGVKNMHCFWSNTAVSAGGVFSASFTRPTFRG